MLCAMKPQRWPSHVFTFLLQACLTSAGWLSLGLLAQANAQTDPLRFEQAPHHYWDQTPNDPYSRWWRTKEGFEPAPGADEKEVLRRFLRALNIPESSQMLVFSATSLQRNIEPANPRALYFNDEIYVGWVPGGRIEIAADDATLGPVFFIQSITRSGGLGEPERQTRCLNCHASSVQQHLPSLLAASVLPDRAGGSLDRFRPEERVGHHSPLSERFGGWHVTGPEAAATPRANLLGQMRHGELTTYPNLPGERFRLENYLRPENASPLLPQLIHEHQIGAVNLLTAALYRAREVTTPGHGPVTEAESAELQNLARQIVRYFLFAEEAALPEGGVSDPNGFWQDFTKNKQTDAQGRSLKDPELKTRLFRYRCSYMIYTPLWRGLPPVIKDRIWRKLHQALTDPSHPDGTHLPADEKQAIRDIIAATCDDRPEWWQ